MRSTDSATSLIIIIGRIIVEKRKFKTYIELHKKPISKKKVIRIMQDDSIPNIQMKELILTNRVKELGLQYNEKGCGMCQKLQYNEKDHQVDGI